MPFDILTIILATAGGAVWGFYFRGVERVRYLYYVVYNFQTDTSSGTGSLTHESNEKIKSLKKINELNEYIKSVLEKEMKLKGIVITNFILLDEVTES